MPAFIDRLKSRAAELESLGSEFLNQHSHIEPSMFSDNEDSDFVVVTAHPFPWRDLDATGRSLQGKLRDRAIRWFRLMAVLLADVSDHTQREFDWREEQMLKLINQDSRTEYETSSAAAIAFADAIRAIVGLAESLYDDCEGTTIIVPDTNALLFHTELENWAFPEFAAFTVVLMPTILGELDKLKVEHRNEDVRDKAKKLIRQIKGYRSRGELTSGVPLRTGRSTIRCEAAEPRAERALSWLDFANNDDRLLASFLEVVRRHVRSDVRLVTLDINLQNKAGFADVPFIEPPEPASSQ